MNTLHWFKSFSLFKVSSRFGFIFYVIKRRQSKAVTKTPGQRVKRNIWQKVWSLNGQR